MLIAALQAPLGPPGLDFIFSCAKFPSIESKLAAFASL
jgi:hypothetical protein